MYFILLNYWFKRGVKKKEEAETEAGTQENNSGGNWPSLWPTTNKVILGTMNKYTCTHKEIKKSSYLPALTRISRHSCCPYCAATKRAEILWSSRASRLHTLTSIRTISLWPLGIKTQTCKLQVRIHLTELCLCLWIVFLPYKQLDEGKSSRTQCVFCWPLHLFWPAVLQPPGALRLQLLENSSKLINTADRMNPII